MEGCRLSVKDLACRRGERLLFRGLGFALNAGEALQVAGPNGTGKSSLLRIVAGLLRPFAGSVEREGSLALVDERLALDEHLPLGRALAFWGRIDTQAPESPLPGGEGSGAGERRASRASAPTLPSPSRGRGTPADRLGLSGLLDVPVRFLSTGQRKRAALARLRGQDAAIWLLDEPLNGLDAATARECERLVAEHCRAGGIALIASHQPFRVEGMRTLQLADFIPPLPGGKGIEGWGLVANGSRATRAPNTPTRPPSQGGGE